MSWNTGVDDSWKGEDDSGFATDGGGFHADDTANSAFDGGDGAGYGEDGASGESVGDGRTCRICNSHSHLARNCPDAQSSMECYNCGQTGHAKADCPNPKVERPFTGTCKSCGQEGHRIGDCPEQECRTCGQKGHKAAACTAKRVELFEKLEPLTMDEAWAIMKKADANRDLDDIRRALLGYFKYKHELSVESGKENDVDLVILEEGLRADDFKLHLIAKKKEIDGRFTFVSPTGVVGQEYQLVLNWGDQPKRKVQAEGWPANKEENKKRLSKAGFLLETGIPRCDQCGEMGHVRKHCKQDPVERTYEAPKIICVNCNEEGHRARECQLPPKPKNQSACRNCNQPGHQAKECPEPRSAENIECKNCGEMGHFSRDCPTRKKITCNNCQQEGHLSRDCQNTAVCSNCEKEGHGWKECPAPKDWSRVTCRQCGEKGHTPTRCPQNKIDATESSAPTFDSPATAEPEGSAGGWNGAGAGNGSGGVPVEATGGW